MGIDILREKLHEYIDVADEQHLSAIYVLVEGSMSAAKSHVYDDATIEMLQKRMENDRKGISKSYTVEESFDMIRQHKK